MLRSPPPPPGTPPSHNVLRFPTRRVLPIVTTNVAAAIATSASVTGSTLNTHPAAWHTGILLHNVSYNDAVSFGPLWSPPPTGQSGQSGQSTHPKEVVEAALEKCKDVASFAEDDVCPICLTSFRKEESEIDTMENMENISVIRECKHAFCSPCITRWLSSHNSCPVCKRELWADAANVPQLPMPRTLSFSRHFDDRDILLVTSALARSRIDLDVGRGIRFHRPTYVGEPEEDEEPEDEERDQEPEDEEPEDEEDEEEEEEEDEEDER